MLAVCSQAQLNPSCPEHVAAVWLHALVWVEDARWRGLQEAAPLEQLSRLLAALHRYAALLQLVFGHSPAEETGEQPPAASLHLVQVCVWYPTGWRSRNFCWIESAKTMCTSAQHVQQTFQGTLLARHAASSPALLKLLHQTWRQDMFSKADCGH